MGHRYPFLDAPTPLAFAHRGGAAGAVENTLEAFGRAVALGYRFVETDVRATRDGVAVVFHDATLRRLTGAAVAVEALSWRDLATVRVGGAAVVPRLEELLGAWPRVRVNVDVKADAAVAAAVDTVRRCGAGGRVLLASFSDARLARLRALAPDLPTSLGRRGVAALRLASWTGRRLRLPASVVAAQVPVAAYGLPVVDARFVRYANRLGLQVHVWTVDRPEQMEALLDLGVDGLMTDRLEVLREVYRRRGCWW